MNQRFGREGYQPVVLFDRHCEPPEIFRLYRAADVCYVSSLHDGMNLVAKEFVSAREDERGVLLLSRFTGAARELTEALVVNPYDLEGVADTLRAALMMNAARTARSDARASGARRRVQRLPLGRPHAARCDPVAPARAFAGAPWTWQLSPGALRRMTDILAKKNQRVLARYALSNLLVAFDYDGTLAPIVAVPERAHMRATTRRLLRRVAERYPCVVISGRARADLIPRLKDIPVAHDLGESRSRAVGRRRSLCGAGARMG